MQKIKKMFKKGDTIIEVTFAIAVFSLISVISMQVMDRNLATIQGALELEMARNEIDAQAEALRFIQNSYLSERELSRTDRTYQNLWLKLSRGSATAISADAGSGLANKPTDISEYYSVACSTYYDTTNGGSSVHNIFKDRAFVLNTRKINPNNINETVVQTTSTYDSSKFVEAPLYPRVIFTKGTTGSNNDNAELSEIFPLGSENLTYQTQTHQVYDRVTRVEGIWVISARDMTKGESATPEFYDFHIRTCWFAPGHERPTIVGTTIRLYNPELIEDQK